MSELSLLLLGAGWIAKAELEAMGQTVSSGAWTFPMRNDRGEAVGVRLRTPGHKKFSVTGSCNGLFMPSAVAATNVLTLAEGESDTAALIDLGFVAIGRPGARSCGDMVVRFVRRTRPAEVVVMADNDGIGKSSAVELASKLRMVCPRVRIVTPPVGIKDVRAWKRSGATHADFVNQVTASPLVGVSLAVEGRE